MISLSVQDAQLAANDRVTLAKLLKLGLGRGHTKYTMTAEALGASGLSTNALVALVRASVPRLLDESGTETRPKTFVASEVTVHCTGSADITLTMDLAT